MEDQGGGGKRLRPKRRTNEIIKLLNADVNNLNLNIATKAGLKAADIKNLAQLRQKLDENSPDINKLGLRSREELQDIFKKNKIPTPTNWIWGE